MKAILEFELPDDGEQLKWALMAGQMFSALKDADHMLRNHLKHGDEARSTEVMNRCKGVLSEVLMRLE